MTHAGCAALHVEPRAGHLIAVFWFWMWGVPGAILAVPMLAILKIVSDRVRPLRALGPRRIKPISTPVKGERIPFSAPRPISKMDASDNEQRRHRAMRQPN